MSVGLTVGKFDPPHRGHSMLFDVARAHVDTLIVLVYDFERQSIPAQVRAAWMKECHPDVDFRVIPNPEPLRAFDPVTYGPPARDFLGDVAIDLVVTSEAYGEGLARIFGARYIAVDRDRTAIPCTSTMIRRDPLNNLQWLQPNVRAHYVRRITVVGSESTGKTSLCAYLAERFSTNWVTEYGREYSATKVKAGITGRWSSAEFVHIAREQQRREDEGARRANRVLICDTDALSTRIWHERYIGRDVDAWPLPPSRTALYLIPFPDVPFVADDVRDSEHLRYWMYERFVDEFKARGYSYEVLNGDFNERRERAVAVIEEEIARCS